VIREEVARLRKEYESVGLQEDRMATDPFTEFESWFSGVVQAGIHEPNAFVLATADADGVPSARAVLMKELSRAGLVFYTGLTSRKSNDMKSNPRAAATFVWTQLHRQVRIEGHVTPVEDRLADAYFASRPRGAQIAAHASHQSSVVERRESLDERYEALAEEFGEDEIPRPGRWGGWRLEPTSVEFWQGRPNRFHDRIRYQLVDGAWVKERLAP
jgi:pyridoxamine 5'-phosphate oxidase